MNTIETKLPTSPSESATTRQVAMQLPSVLGYEKIARRTVEAVAEQMNFTLDRVEDIKTAVAEACMNAIEHGNQFDRDHDVKVRMAIMPDKLEVRVADVGCGTIPDTLPEPGNGDMRGWGLFLIKNLVDEITLSRLPDGGNEIAMVLYLKSGESSAASEKKTGTTAEQVHSAPSTSPSIAAVTSNSGSTPGGSPSVESTSPAEDAPVPPEELPPSQS